MVSWILERHQVVANGESGDVRGETVSFCKEQLPEIAVEYEAKDVWNQVVFGEKEFREKGKE